MGNTALETLRKMLNISSLAQMLFEQETMLAASPEAERLFPEARTGNTAEHIFGTTVEQYRQFKGSGSMFFTGELAGILCDVTVTALSPYALVTASATYQVQKSSTMLSVAQRVRQPMASIMAITPKLFPLLEETSDRYALTRASEINQSLYQILRITGNLELYADSRLVLHRSRVDLGMWLQTLADRLEPLIQSSHKTLEYLRPVGSCLCSIDETQMERALLNLIANAMQFTTAGDAIFLSYKQHGNRVIIVIRDQGSGIPADQMGTIFQRSEHRGQIPDPRWGIGLGLPVTRNVVEAHGGRLMLESEEHVGTAVYISLDTRTDSDNCILRSPVHLPEVSNGIDPVLVALSDVLPPSVFDTRGLDL